MARRGQDVGPGVGQRSGSEDNLYLAVLRASEGKKGAGTRGAVRGGAVAVAWGGGGHDVGHSRGSVGRGDGHAAAWGGGRGVGCNGVSVGRRGVGVGLEVAVVWGAVAPTAGDCSMWGGPP